MPKHVSNSLPVLLGMVLLLSLTGCGLFESEEDDGGFRLSPEGTYILCEGVFGAFNASLWHLSSDLDTATANVYQRLTGEPLGDTGQSLTVDGNRLYIVVNGSGTVEVLDLSEDTLAFVGSVNLIGASPREMVVLGAKAYVTSWNIPGIVVFDPTTLAIVDTIFLTAKPEDILAHDNQLYVALALQPDFSANDQVVKIDPGSGTVVDTFALGSGPQQLLVRVGKLLVSRLWYSEDYTISYRGLAAVDLTTGAVTSVDWGAGGGVDIFALDNTVYVATGTGVVPIRDDLSLDEAGLIEGSLPTVYAAASDGTRIFIASYSDFSTPGEVAVYQSDGTALTTITVGIGPGAFASFRE